MSISGVSNSSMAIMPIKVSFTAKNLSEGTPLQMENKNGKFDTVELSISAREADANAKPLELTHTELAKVDLSKYENTWAVTIYADGRVDDPMADYNRSQGNYFGDVWSAAMAMPSGRDIYQNAIASGMTEEEAWEEQRRITTEHFRNNLDESLALANKFSPLNSEATGKTISYSDVYDKHGELKAPSKISPAEYQKNLQNILSDMMSYISANQNQYPNLYQTHFAD